VVAELTKTGHHCLKAAAEVRDRGGPCLAVRNSADNNRARDSRWPRNSSSRWSQAVHALGSFNIVDCWRSGLIVP
jgi:hypothetical protein